MIKRFNKAKKWYIVLGHQKGFVVVPKKNINGRRVFDTVVVDNFATAVEMKIKKFGSARVKKNA